MNERSTGDASTSRTTGAGRHRDRLPPAAWAVFGLAVGAAVWLGITAMDPPAEELLPTVNRWLVRAGLPLFYLAFAASPLARLRPSPFARRLLRERRGIGLAWAMIHLTHAAAILVSFEVAAENVPPLFVLAFGGTGFVFTLAMALTSNDASQRALGRGWRRLHRTGLWYLVFIYAYTYLGRVLEAPSPWPVFALGLFVAIALARAVVWSRRRSGSGGVARAAG